MQANMSLSWPSESAAAKTSTDCQNDSEIKLTSTGPNIVLDAHGDLSLAKLKIFSDGNHHMALEKACQLFLQKHPSVQDVFYTTAPPGPQIDSLLTNGCKGKLNFGNLSLTVNPNVFIAPENVIAKLVDGGKVVHHRPFAQSRGVVLLIRKGNPLKISGVCDLLRPEIRLACSNPSKERASFAVYSETLSKLVANASPTDCYASQQILDLLHDSERTVHSGRIHHREIPEILFSDKADVAPAYYHLALRYVSIFPDFFDFIPLGGTKENPTPGPEHKLTTYHVSVLEGNGGEWGEKFAEFMTSDEVREIYKSCGLTVPVP